jgi:hypothetical protein
MTKVFRIAAIWFLCSSSIASADFQTGNQLLRECDNYPLFCLGYIMAIADTLRHGDIAGFHACVPPHVLGGQLEDIVVQALRRYPSYRDLDAVGLAAAAISGAFPCP